MTPVLLCLHGWGGSKESFTELRAALDGSSLTMLTPDLPGFGAEPEPPEPWTVENYADWVESWTRKKLQNGDGTEAPVHLLGHSHGGRIALALAARGNIPLRHLHLCASAGIPHRRMLRRSLGWMLSKTGSLLLSIPGLRRLQPIGKRVLYRLFRVHDYEKASPVMRETMRNVQCTDLRPLLPTINVPTDIFWGTDDTMTPLADGKLMHRHIKGSTLHVFPGVRHRVHRDRAAAIASVILNNLDSRSPHP
ncbi:MAG: alpha/beta hydrolase [Candidatus Peribacteraceae bacterium]|nr:alpha/beta hydrolase [Candidatus Peribacteraceae bacterium]